MKATHRLLGPKAKKFPMLACGCRAHAIDGDGNPCCVVHWPDPRARQAIEEPQLEGRIARCSICKCEKPSIGDLPFFVYKGDGSRHAGDICANCSFAKVAHERPKKDRNRIICNAFKPTGPAEFDEFYCGCRGWN